MIKMKAEEFDKRFDEGEDIDSLMEADEILSVEDLKKRVKEENRSVQTIEIDLNNLMIDKLKEKAEELNVNMNDLIKVILAERLGIL